MMAQQTQNNIFVRECISKVRLSKSCMGHKRLDSRQKDKKIQFEGNNTLRSSLKMKCSYILSSFFKYKLSSLFCLFFFLVIPPYFLRGFFSLYSPIPFQSQPSICWLYKWSSGCLSHQSPPGTFVCDCKTQHHCSNIIST